MLLKTIVLLFSSVSVFGGPCEVSLKSDIAKKDPVFLRFVNGTIELWAPEGPSLNWKKGQENILLCSGSSNVLTLTTVATNRISCSDNKTFKIGIISETIDKFECKSAISGDVVVTDERCGEKSERIVNLGFTSSEFGFISYIQICYDMERASVLWTRHLIPGKAIKYSMNKGSRPGFKVTGIPSHVKPATSYTQESQLQRLTVLLGSENQAKKFIYTNSYMARGHLAPDADGIYTSWQFTTYFYLNVAPQWQAVNNGNWLRVENAARKIAEQYQEDILIFTGNAGNLKLPHENGTKIPISLEDGGIEAPRWYWKIIISREKDAGIAFVSSNNPFESEIEESEFICKNICLESGWGIPEYENYAKGYTYCCDPNEILRNIPNAPEEARVGNLLTKEILFQI